MEREYIKCMKEIDEMKFLARELENSCSVCDECRQSRQEKKGLCAKHEKQRVRINRRFRGTKLGIESTESPSTKIGYFIEH